MTLEQLEVLVTQVRPEFTDSMVAAAVLHFLDTRIPATYKGPDGVWHENVDRLPARVIADPETCRAIVKLEARTDPETIAKIAALVTSGAFRLKQKH